MNAIKQKPHYVVRYHYRALREGCTTGVAYHLNEIQKAVTASGQPLASFGINEEELHRLCIKGFRREAYETRESVQFFLRRKKLTEAASFLDLLRERIKKTEAEDAWEHNIRHRLKSYLCPLLTRCRKTPPGSSRYDMVDHLLCALDKLGIRPEEIGTNITELLHLRDAHRCLNVLV